MDNHIEQERAEARIDKANLLEWMQKEFDATKDRHDIEDRPHIKILYRGEMSSYQALYMKIESGNLDCNSLDREEQLIKDVEQWKNEALLQARLYTQKNEKVEQLIAENERLTRERDQPDMDLYVATNNRDAYKKFYDDSQSKIAEQDKEIKKYKEALEHKEQEIERLGEQWNAAYDIGVRIEVDAVTGNISRTWIDRS